MSARPDARVRVRYLSVVLLLAATAAAAVPAAAAEARVLELRRGDRICVVGNGFAERFRHFGYFESGLLAAFPDLDLSARNLAWSGDETGLGLRPLNFGSLHDHLEARAADVVLMSFGANESFAGDDGLAAFREDLGRLLRDVSGRTYNDSEPPRIALISPVPQEALPDGRGLDADAIVRRNADLRAYAEAAAGVAADNSVAFLDIFDPMAAAFAAEPSPLTTNGLHLNEAGYWHAARALVDALGGPDPALIEISMTGRAMLEFKPPPVLRGPDDGATPPRIVISDLDGGHRALRGGGEILAWADAAGWAAGVELPAAATASLAEAGDRLRSAVLRKSRLFFDRYRAVNGYYFYGGRKGDPFGRGSSAPEMARFEELVTQLDAEVAGLVRAPEVWRLVPADPDATLSALALSGVDIGTFSAATASYTAEAAHAVEATTVTATAAHANAAVSVAPTDADRTVDGHQIALSVGGNAITVTVTAEDTVTTRRYTVTVTRASAPLAILMADASPVTEGAAAAFTVALDKAAGADLTVSLDVDEDGAMLSDAPAGTVIIGAGETSARLEAATTDDVVVESDSLVTATLTAGAGYALGARTTATVMVEDDDEAVFEVTAAPSEIEEGDDAAVTVAVTNGVTYAEDKAVLLTVTGMSAEDYALTPTTATLASGESALTATLTATVDGVAEDPETALIEATLDGSAIGSAGVAIADPAPPPEPVIAGVAQVGGTLEAAFSEAPRPDVEVQWLRDAEEIAGATGLSYAPTASDVSRSLSVRVERRAVSRTSAATGPVWPAPANPPLTGGEEELLGAVLTLESTDAFPVDIAGYGQLGDVRFGSLTGGDFEVGGTRYAVTTAAVNNQGRFVLGTRPHLTGTEGLTVYWNGYRMRAFAETTLLGERYWGTAATQPKSEYGRYWDGASDGVRVALSIRRTARVPTASIAADAATVGEGGAARYTVTVDEAPGADLAVSVSVTDEAGALVSAPPSTVTVAAGAMSATLTLATDDDAVDEADGAVTVELLAGAGYDLGAATSATTTVTDDDVATFEVTAAPSEIAEGGASTVTVSVADGVTFAADVGIELAVTGVSADDYELAPADLSLPAGETRVTATLTATDDDETEEAETATVTARVDGAAVGSAAVSIRDVSEDASLAALELSDVDIGAFDAEVTAYTAEVAHAIGSTTVEATPTDANASVEITDATGSTLGTRRTSALAQGANDIAARVTAEDGATRRTYAVTVTRVPRWGARLRDRDIALADASAPTGLWSDGRTVWIADVYEGVLAYALSDGARLPGRDIDVAAVSRPSALWSDGATLWVADYDGGVRAYRLADGGRLSNEDLDADVMTAAGNNIPTGLWSDGETLLVADNADGRAYAYALSDGGRVEDAEFSLRGGDLRNMQPYGLWSDGETLLASHWTRGWVRGYRLSDGARRSARDINAQAQGNSYPRGLWSDGETLWVVDYVDRRLYAYAVPGLRRDGGELSELVLTNRAEGVPGTDPGPPVSIPDAGLRARVGAALGKAPGDAIGANELAALAALDARDAGVADLAGLERAVNLEGLDLGLNPLVDLRALESLPALRTLNLDGTSVDPWALAGLRRLERLSLRDNGIEDLAGLESLTALRALDVGGNRIADLSPLAGLASLTALRADGNVIADLWPLSGLGELATLDLRDNAIEDVSPLAALRALVEVDLRGNRVADFSALDGNRRLRVIGAERGAPDAGH